MLEPTCGKGSFIRAALETFSTLSTVVGVEINPEYVNEALRSCRKSESSVDVRILQGDFFKISALEIGNILTEPILVVGNPPWVTNSQMSSIEGANLPSKANCQRLAGMDALMERAILTSQSP